MSATYKLRSTRPGWLQGLLPASALLAGILLAPAAHAAFNNASPRAAFAGNINYVVTGGTLRTADNATDACAVTTGPVTAPLTVPAGATIVAAYLYWGGSGATNDANVTINGNNVTADANFSDTYVVSGVDTLQEFGDFKDITSLGVVTTGTNTYTFNNLTVETTDNGVGFYCTDQAVQSGWALIVVYTLATENYRVINVYDGIQAFRGSQITTTPANFKIPASPIDGKFTVVTWEGDPTNSGTLNGFSEALTFNGATLTDGCNPLNNQYNSTINTLTCTGNPATDDIYYGVDIDSYDVSADLAAAQTSANLVYSSGADLVYLAAEVISTTDVPVTDLAITKSHSGTLVYGTNVTWTLAVKNNGPSTTASDVSNPVKVTDTLQAGVTYISATGAGWTCNAAGQVVTCTSTTAVASGASFPNITLTASIGGTTVSPLVNTATVAASNDNFDTNSTNNSSTDSAAIISPDLSTSTKSVFTVGGGDAQVGSTLQYTITLTESAGVVANNISVTDDVPANLSGFTVTSFPAGATNSSTGAGTGLNNDGFVNITGITVPANGSVTIVFTAQVAAGTLACTNIDNNATVTNPDGPGALGATPGAPTVQVAQSSCASSGNKVLYLYDNTGPTYTNLLNRVPQTVNTGTAITIGRGANHVWNLSPALAKALVLTAGNVTVTLVEQATGANTGTNRPTTVTLLNNGVAVATSGNVNVANGPTAHTYTIVGIPATTILSGNTLGIRFNNNTGTNNRNVAISQMTAAQGKSTVTFATSTVINVDSVTAYTTAYPGTTLPPNGVFLPGQTVFVCAVVSDPFGSADTDPATGGTAPKATLTDPNGIVQVNAAAMTNEAAANCAGTASTSTEAFEYAFVTSSGTTTGFWNAAVKASEGTEGTVTNTANSAFDIEVPSLLIAKTASVASDPVEGATRSKAIPGATVTYTITVQNNGRGPVDSGTLVISDPIPANTAMSLTGKPPFTFTDGATASGLSVTAGSDANIVYSNNGGASYAYVPGCTRPCTDTAITNFKITLTGSMNGKLGAGTPSFKITFNVVIQ